MGHVATALPSSRIEVQQPSSGVLLRTLVIGLTAFLTVVDLFATQAILPSLTRAYQVTPAAMASAVNATLAYLGENCSAADAAGAFAAYITGNVASNLIGRLMSAALADHLGLAWNFYFFAALNLAGAVLVYFTVARAAPMEQARAVAPAAFAAWLVHLRNSQLRAAFGIGFCILFAFIGTFTYVNFVLVRPPLSLGPMQLGFVYVVFLPSIVTTLGAGRAVHRFGTRPTLLGSLAFAGAGLPLLLLPDLAAVLLGMVLVGVGT